MWILEFTGTSIGQAQDVVRQHCPAGGDVPTVQETGRYGYELATSDYDLIIAVKMHVEHGGGRSEISKRED